MIRHDFSQFSYAINNDSAKKGKKEILVCFMYNGTEVLKKVYIPEKEGTAYIFEAKKIIDQEMRNGDLAAYAHKFAAKNKKKEGGSSKPKTSSSSSSSSNVGYALPPKKGLKIAFVIVCILFVAAAALAVLFMLKKPSPEVGKVSITFDGNGGSWTTGQNIEYSKTITVDKGTKWSEVSTPDTTKLTKDDNSFDYWTINGKKPDSGYVFESASTTVSANYKNDTVTLEFSRGANGTWDDGTPGLTKEISVVLGSSFADVKDKVKVTANEDWEFDYFTDGTVNQSPLGDSYKFSKNDKGKTFEAKYYATASSTVVITADANGGTWKEQAGSLYEVEVDKHSTWESAKPKFSEMIVPPTGYDQTAPSWEYFTGSAWAPLNDNYTFDINTQIKAVYTPNKFNVKFDATPGTFPGESTTQTIEVNYNDTFAKYSSDSRLEVTPPEGRYFAYFTYGSNAPLADSYVFDGSVTEFKAIYNDQDRIYLVIDASGGLIDGQPSILDRDLLTGSGWNVVTTELIKYKQILVAPEGKDFKEWQYYNGTSWVPVPTGTETVAEAVLRIRAAYDNKNITVKFSSGEGTWLSGGSEDIVFDQGEVRFEDTFADFKQEHGDKIKVTAPTRHTFLYFTDENNKVVGDDYVLVDGKTYTAQYMRVQSDFVTVTIDPQGGTISESTDALLLDNVAIDSTWNDVKTAHPEIATLVDPTGSQFKEWQYYDGSDWDTLEDTYVFNVNTRVKAVYESTKIQTITFSAGNGTWADGTTTAKTKENADYGTTLAELDSELNLTVNPADDRHVFTYFAITPDVGDPIVIGPDYAFTDSETVVAQYAPSEEVVDLHIDLGGGTIGGQNSFDLELVKGTTWAQLENAYGNPTPPDGQRLMEGGFFYAGGEGELPVSSTTIFDGNITSIYAKYEDIPTTTNDFATDDWATFTSVFNLGFDFASTNAEGENGGYQSAFEGKGGTFVGLTRTVTIGDVNYEVKVIGENKDLLTGDTDTAALTFEFTNAITDAVPFSTLADNSKDYENSNLEKYLNNDVYNMLPKDLRDNIKGVDKTIYDPSSAAAVPTKVISNKLFSLSLSEMGVATLPSGTAVLNEGSAYQAYTGGTIDYVKRNKANTAVPYWVRTSDFEFPEVKGAWCFDATGALGIEDPDDPISGHVSYDILCGLAVVPAFCIGVGA